MGPFVISIYPIYNKKHDHTLWVFLQSIYIPRTRCYPYINQINPEMRLNVLNVSFLPTTMFVKHANDDAMAGKRFVHYRPLVVL